MSGTASDLKDLLTASLDFRQMDSSLLLISGVLGANPCWTQMCHIRLLLRRTAVCFHPNELSVMQESSFHDVSFHFSKG